MSIKKLLPRYSYAPIIILAAFIVLVYFGSKIINGGMEHHDITIWLDDMITPCYFFIVFYVLAYVQWAVGYIMIARESQGFCYQYFGAEIIAKICCFVIFVVFPTTMVRPEIVGNDIFSNLVSYMYQIDTPTNLFPSIHCLESWLIARASFEQRSVSKGYKIVMLIMSIMVFASVVLVKQHGVLDILGGILVVELGIFIAKKLKLSERDKLWIRKK